MSKIIMIRTIIVSVNSSVRNYFEQEMLNCKSFPGSFLKLAEIVMFSCQSFLSGIALHLINKNHKYRISVWLGRNIGWCIVNTWWTIYVDFMKRLLNCAQPLVKVVVINYVIRAVRLRICTAFYVVLNILVAQQKLIWVFSNHIICIVFINTIFNWAMKYESNEINFCQFLRCKQFHMKTNIKNINYYFPFKLYMRFSRSVKTTSKNKCTKKKEMIIEK